MNSVDSTKEFRTKGLSGLCSTWQVQLLSLLIIAKIFLLNPFVGARGVSVVFSSGDDGVGDGISDPAFSFCISNDGKNKTEFIPTFPPTCP